MLCLATIFGLGLFVFLSGDGGAPSPTEARPVPSLLAPWSAGAQPRRSERSYDLRPAKDGSGDLVYDAPGFTAHVERDGFVRFRDKHSLGVSLPWAPLRTLPGTPTLQGLLEQLNGKNHVRKYPGPLANRDPPDYVPPPGPIAKMSPYRPDPSGDCRYPEPCYFEPGIALADVSGEFDLTDALMRLGGKDPYRYEKARFLGATQPLRIRLAARAHAEDLRRAVAELPLTLEAIACDERLSAKERRAILEALRGEMDGTTAAAQEVAARISRFIASHFAAGADGGVSCPSPPPAGP